MNKEEIERIIENKVSEKINKYNTETARRNKRHTIIFLIFLGVIIMLGVALDRYITDKRIERRSKQEDYIRYQLREFEKRLLEQSSLK